MLEAAFVAWLVALLGDRTLKGIVRVVLGDPERRRLEAALAEVSKVAMAAVLRDIPIESREQVSSALAERFNMAPATVFDGRTRVRTALINAIRKQIAPLGDITVTRAGRFSPDQAGAELVPLADALANIAIRSIEQVGQGFTALAPLVAQLNADAAAERDEAMALKVDSVLATLEHLRQTPNAPWRDQNFVPDSLDRLADALLRIPSIADDNSRSEILKRLPDPLRSSIPRSSTPRVQVYQIVDTCGTYPHGLRDLRAVIYSFERESLSMRQLDEVILEIGSAGGNQYPPVMEADGGE